MGQSQIFFFKYKKNKILMTSSKCTIYICILGKAIFVIISLNIVLATLGHNDKEQKKYFLNFYTRAGL